MKISFAYNLLGVQQMFMWICLFLVHITQINRGYNLECSTVQKDQQFGYVCCHCTFSVSISTKVVAIQLVHLLRRVFRYTGHPANTVVVHAQ